VSANLAGDTVELLFQCVSLLPVRFVASVVLRSLYRVRDNGQTIIVTYHVIIIVIIFACVGLGDTNGGFSCAQSSCYSGL
jgi:hypothetical protein